MNIIVGFILLGIAQGIFFGIVLISIKRGNRSANRVIGTLMIAFAISISHAVLIKTGFFLIQPHLLKVAFPLLFLFGPLFLLYVNILTQKEFHLNKKYLYHFTPFILLVIYLLPFYLKSAEEKLQLIHVQHFRSTGPDYIISLLQIIHVFIYIYVVNKKLKEHDLNLKNSYSSVEQINLAWLRKIMQGMIFVFLVMSGFFVLAKLGHVNILREYGAVTIAVLVSYYLYKMGYLAFKQPEIFTSEKDEPVIKYEKSTLPESKKNEYLDNLFHIMDSKKPHVNSNLTIQVLAETSKIPAYHLSQILNEKLNKNFFDFINGYRIEEAKNKLQDPQNNKFSILAIAYDVGFNSKSAFNNAFKKHTSMTPSQFRDKIH